MFKQDETG